MSFEQLVEDLKGVDTQHLTSGQWYHQGDACPLAQVGMKRGVLTVDEIKGELLEDGVLSEYVLPIGADDVIVERLAWYYAVTPETVEVFYGKYDELATFYGTNRTALFKAIAALEENGEVIYDED